jgi:subtilase family serine protease
MDSQGNYISETAWSGSGGGISQYEAQPGYQQGVVTQSVTARTIPDVAFDGDPNTGVAVYNTGNGASTPWAEEGGTSVGAPAWAGIIAIADQGLALAGDGSLAGATQTLPDLYALPAGDFHAITTGGNGGYWAGPGYNLVTGRGSPIANLLVPGLVAEVAGPAPVISEVSMVALGGGSNWQITINGSGFGTQAAYNGDSADLEIGDFTTAMVAGNTGDGVGANVTSWNNNQIVISSLTGAYGSNGWVINAGDSLILAASNAQDGLA